MTVGVFNSYAKDKDVTAHALIKDVTSGTLNDHYDRYATATAAILLKNKNVTVRMFNSYVKDKDVTAGALIKVHGA